MLSQLSGHLRFRFSSLPFLIIALSLAIGPRIADADAPTHADLVFATVEGKDLKLNLFLPENVEAPPLVIYIHGGGWRSGSYEKCPVTWLRDHGFAVASVGYRLVDVATFPAQIHDVKAAVRWLRAHAEDYGYDGNRIGVSGSSAGGHLSMLLGVSSGVEALEGTVGDHLDQDSHVDAIVDYYGASDFVLRSRTQPSKTEEPGGSAYGLLAGSTKKQPEKATLASPAFHVTEDDPPMLVIHGKKDPTVLFDQAERIRDAYNTQGLELEFCPIEEGRHGGNEFYQGEYRDRVIAFLTKHLQAKNP